MAIALHSAVNNISTMCTAHFVYDKGKREAHAIIVAYVSNQVGGENIGGSINGLPKNP